MLNRLSVLNRGARAWQRGAGGSPQGRQPWVAALWFYRGHIRHGVCTRGRRLRAKRPYCAGACHSGTHMCIWGCAAFSCGCFVGVKVPGPLYDLHGSQVSSGKLNPRYLWEESSATLTGLPVSRLVPFGLSYVHGGVCCLLVGVCCGS